MSSPLPSAENVRRKQAWKEGHEIAGKSFIDGAVKGDLHGKGITIGPEGKVTGNIFAEEVTVLGAVEGHICAGAIHLGPHSRVRGLVLWRHHLSADLGADFEGRSMTLARFMKEHAARQASSPAFKLAAE